MSENALVQHPPLAPTVDDLICAALRGENPAWPWGDDAAKCASLLDRVALHGVGALLHSQPGNADWPPAVQQQLRAQAVQQAMWEMRHQQVLAHTLLALDGIGVQPVLIKGTALAYSLYANPVLRTRADTDLIIPMDAKDQVDDALVSLGFARSLGVSGEFVSYQASYTLQTPDGGAHTLDLHWKINNSELLSRLFTYDELADDSQPLPQLCAHALGASRVHALLLACMHRSTHKQNPYYVDGESHHEADRLIWLYDIHLLAGQLNPREWTEVVRLAGGKGLRAVCLEGMEHAHGCFNTAYPEAVLAALAQPGKAEPAARYLAGGKLRQQWMDFCALGSIPHQLRLIRETLLPSKAYMRAKYPTPSFGGLPGLYLRRFIGGLLKTLRRADHT